MKRLLPCLTALLLIAPRLPAAYCPTAPLFSRLSGTVVVPAEFRDHSFMVQAMINGRGPFRLLVDTGSAVSLISPEVANAVGARQASTLEAAPTAINGLDEEVDIQEVLLDTLAIGGARFEGVPAGVTADLAAVALSRGQKLDGVLGFSVFSDVLLGIDFPGRRLIVSSGRPDGLPPVQTELEMQSRDEIPVISARLQGHDLQLVVDTGATAGLVLPPQLASSAYWKAEPRPGALVSVLGASTREVIGRLKGELHLGRVAHETPVASILEGPPCVGVDFLRNFCLLFDQAHDKMWLCSESDEPLPSRPVRSLGLCLLSDGAGWRVAGIIPGSPAESAGISPGDVVTRIEGQPAGSWSRDQIDGWTDAHPQVALSVVHENSTRDFVLPAWQLVP